MPKTRPLQLELEILEDLDAKPHANSGAMKKKHDGSDDEFLYEIKTTQKNSYSIKSIYWDELKKQAIARRLEPIMVLVFDKGVGSHRDQDKVVIMDYENFKAIMERDLL